MNSFKINGGYFLAIFKMEDDRLSVLLHEIFVVIRRYDLKGLDNIRAHIQHHLFRRKTFHREMARTAQGSIGTLDIKEKKTLF